MAKKMSWFSLVKRFFTLDTHSTKDKVKHLLLLLTNFLLSKNKILLLMSQKLQKEKRRKWIFGRLKTKRLPSIKAPQKPSKETALSGGALEEPDKHALTVAIASAEAAVTAAQVAAQVVGLTLVPQSANQCDEKEEEFQPPEDRNNAPESSYQFQREIIEESAAIKIQTAFRGYLARKALRALKGIVKLQAIIRGRAIRRQAMSTLKCLQSIVSIQSQICARRLQMVEGRCDCDENEEMQGPRDKIIRMDSNSEKRGDESILLKEEVDASYISKKEAVLKRDRTKVYSFNHRRSAESERNKVNGRWRYWMEQWVDTQLSKSKEFEDLDSVYSSHSRAEEEWGRRQLKLRNIQRQNEVEGLNSPALILKKSFPHRRQCSEGEEDHSTSSSRAIPTYMAATKSTQAKIRSTSSPKVRTENSDSESASYSPCKKKLSIVSSINREVLSSGNQQRSPSLRGISRPIKSSRTMKDLRINSDCSLPNSDQPCSFK